MRTATTKCGDQWARGVLAGSNRRLTIDRRVSESDELLMSVPPDSLLDAVAVVVGCGGRNHSKTAHSNRYAVVVSLFADCRAFQKAAIRVRRAVHGVAMAIEEGKVI